MIDKMFLVRWIVPAMIAGLGTVGLTLPASAAESWQISMQSPIASNALVLANAKEASDIIVDANDSPVVKLAATLLSDDVERVTGYRPAVRTEASKTRQIILVGTLGHNALIDQLSKRGKLTNLAKLRDHWETTLCQMVDKPFPGVNRAFVVVGSDRRGAAYGLMDISEKIGVSPWYWWADVPVPHQNTLAITAKGDDIQSPSVKYRGFFINDEDWGLQPWAAHTFDAAQKNIGPKTYDKVFELMLRLKLNYLWPAMHPVTTEFGSIPENAQLADKYAIVMGASHAEPMLRNNIWWPKDKGPWRYDTNRDNIRAYWQEGVQARSNYEAVWTLGIRGIHDSGMQGPKDMASRIGIVTQTFTDQRDLLDKYVNKQWGPIAQCFVPYKEVQPIYDAGLEVPSDVTLVWADDNYGYLRRLSSPAERKRSGGAGFYYHLSYYGGPHSYTWINTTTPAQMWEEMDKAWDNDAKTLWIINVGDIKPMEIGIDFFARLAWNPEAFGPDAQSRYLSEFSTRVFGKEHANEIAPFLAEYYRLGQIRKPESMTRSWTATLSPQEITTLTHDYQALLDREKSLAIKIPPASQDAWTELVGYPARTLAEIGRVFLSDRLALRGINADTNNAAVQTWRSALERDTKAFNSDVAGGKWQEIMPTKDLTGKSGRWSQMFWPWLEPQTSNPAETVVPDFAGQVRKASAFDRRSDGSGAHWVVIDGLGHTGSAVALNSAALKNGWEPSEIDTKAPCLEYDFDVKAPVSEIVLNLMPTFRLYPGMKLRLAVSTDSTPSAILEVPGSSGSEDENGRIRQDAVCNNRVQLSVPMALAIGKHTVKIRPVDPGIVLDEIALH